MQRHLVHDRSTVDKPADRADIGPGQRRVVEDRRIFRLPRKQLLGELVARHAERFGGAIEIEPVARLVLHLGEQDRLAVERRRAGDPVAFGKLSDDFRMGVLRNLPDQRLAIALGHPFLGLDLDIGIDPLLEGAFLRVHLVERLGPGAGRFDLLCVHIRLSVLLRRIE